MPEIVRILTNDQGAITHVVTEDEDRLTVEELAQQLTSGGDYYITLGEMRRFPITIIVEDGALEPTIDDPEGEHTIWDLPQEEDPAEREILEMLDEIDEMGESDDDEPGHTAHPSHPEELL